MPDLTVILTSYPFWIAVVAVVGLVLFRAPITRFIDRLKRLGLGGWGADAHPPGQPPTVPSPTTPIEVPPSTAGAGGGSPREIADRLIANFATNPYIRTREDAVKQGFAAAGLPLDSAETVRVLLVTTAVLAVSTEFEQIYNHIWGSQLRILQEINGAGAPVHPTQLKHIFDAAAAAHPDVFRGYGYSDYLAFLTRFELLMADSVGNLSITLKGRTFLLYLINGGRSLTRPG